MITTLVFDTEISGHHREYLNHLFLRAGEKANERFIFVVHPDLQDVKYHLVWPIFPNVMLDYLDKKQIGNLNGSILKSSYARSMLLKVFVNRHNPSKVFLDSIIAYLPFIAVVLNNNVKVSGTVFSIFTRKYKNQGFRKRILDNLKYCIFSRCKLFDRIFLMNDPVSARLLNRKFRCSKFHYLPDPVSIIPLKSNNLPEECKIAAGKKIFLHFGTLAERKGTVDILKSLELIDETLLKRSCFIFAGIINDDIESDFRRLVEELSEKVQIVVFEGFCSYELLSNLCSVAGYLILPYKSGSNSSGLLGYAAQYNLPVIGTSDGLLGSLIASFNLGYTYDLTNPSKLARALETHLVEPSREIDGTSYLKANSVSRFQKIVFE